MASKQQKKLQKQKAREKSSHDKVLRLRAKKRAIDKEEREEFRKNKLIKKIKRDMEGLDIWADEVYQKMPEKTLKQLQHNAKILQALEEEYEEEMKSRNNLQSELKEEGAENLGEMVDVMHKRASDDAVLNVIKAPEVSDANSTVDS
jgi:hypothetical protein